MLRLCAEGPSAQPIRKSPGPHVTARKPLQNHMTWEALDHMKTRILHSGRMAQDKGDSRNHGMQDPFPGDPNCRKSG